ncbi:MAG: outer membrane lipoprotein carrier protein LolA [Bacteroidales bacterium]|nr:outer membrane lipoprotein carrier protein LolA [Bacteroidales bacterium]
MTTTMRIPLLPLLLALSLAPLAPLGAQSPTPLDAAQRAEFVQRLTHTAQRTQRLECDFEQRRHVSVLTEAALSEGRMAFEAPSSLSWEYTKPQPLRISLHNGQCQLSNAQGAMSIAPQAQRMLQSLAQLIGGLVDGTALANPKMFDTELLDLHNGKTLARLTPKQTKLRRLYQRIEMEVDNTTMRSTTVRLHEPSGDYTEIAFSRIITTNQ